MKDKKTYLNRKICMFILSDRYLSVTETAIQFNVSKYRVHKAIHETISEDLGFPYKYCVALRNKIERKAMAWASSNFGRETSKTFEVKRNFIKDFARREENEMKQEENKKQLSLEFQSGEPTNEVDEDCNGSDGEISKLEKDITALEDELNILRDVIGASEKIEDNLEFLIGLKKNRLSKLKSKKS